MLSFSRSLVLTHGTHTITLHVFHLLHWLRRKSFVSVSHFAGWGTLCLAYYSTQKGWLCTQARNASPSQQDRQSLSAGQA